MSIDIWLEVIAVTGVEADTREREGERERERENICVCFEYGFVECFLSI